MAESVLVINVLQPGDSADELLAAIAAKLGRELIEVAADGVAYLYLTHVSWEEGYALAEQALVEAGDEGQFVVRVRHR